jgi:hypothetical protein
MPEQRSESDKDVKRVESTFKKLGFYVKTRTNLTAKQMVKKIEKDAKMLENTDFACFVCIIMARGNFDQIFGVDGKFVCLEDLIWPVQVCSGLTGKPKLFFVEARGKDNLVGEHFTNYTDVNEVNYLDVFIQYITDNQNAACRHKDSGGPSYEIWGVTPHP